MVKKLKRDLEEIKKGFVETPGTEERPPVVIRTPKKKFNSDNWKRMFQEGKENCEEVQSRDKNEAKTLTTTSAKTMKEGCKSCYNYVRFLSESSNSDRPPVQCTIANLELLCEIVRKQILDENEKCNIA